MIDRAPLSVKVRRVLGAGSMARVMSDQMESELFRLAHSPSHLLHRAEQLAADRFGQLVGADGVTLRQFAVLAAIAENPGLSQSDLVRATRVAESPVNLECKLVQIVDVSSKPLGGSIVLGEVVRFHIADALFNNYKIDPDVLRAIGRMGGPTYTRTKDRFDLPRPSVSL